jgi:RND family efflux transporter MFP subunit
MKAFPIPSRPSLIALATGGTLLFLGLWCARHPAVPVEAAAARRAQLTVEVNTNGKIEPVPEAEVRVHARLEGRIIEIPEPGTRLEAGDVVLRIDDRPVASELAAAKSERLASLEALRAARDTFERVRRKAAIDQDLFEQGALVRQRHAESQAALEDASSRLANLKHEVPLRVASLDLRIQELSAQREAATLTAPFSGTVYRTEFKKGEMVRVGDPILWLADLTRLRVRANIDQVDLGRVREGQRMRVNSNAYPDRRWSARVSELVPHVIVRDNRSVSEALALVDPPTDGLVPGMNVDVDVIVDDVPDALQVPAAAVYTEDGRPFVYRVAQGRALWTPVTLGRSSVGAVEILGGLEAEDQVIVGGSNGLRDGSRIEARIPNVAAR